MLDLQCLFPRVFIQIAQVSAPLFLKQGHKTASRTRCHGTSVDSVKDKDDNHNGEGSDSDRPICWLRAVRPKDPPICWKC